MQYRRLGKSALKVSSLCLGTMNFGPRTAKEDAFEILNQAMTAGLNFIDTANQYGGSLGVGTSEQIIGEWFRQDRSRRKDIVLATKVYEPMSDEVNDRGLSARHIEMACDASLQRLGVDHIDLYQMHHLDRSAPYEEIWQAMDRLITQGKITYVGSSNFPGWVIAGMSERARAKDRLGLVSEQSLYNLVERRVELEVLPACREYGLGFIPWSPLAGGLLAGNSKNKQGRSVQFERSKQVAQYEAFCEQFGASPAAVAQAWLLHQPGVTSIAAGPATVEQLARSIAVADLSLEQDSLDALDAIFPPCGEAPEAYAW